MAAGAPEPGTDPLRQLIDLMVYAPVGLITAVSKDLPNLIATGRARVESQLTVAKFVGKMAVRQVKSELDRRLDEAERARSAGAPATVASNDDERPAERRHPEPVSLPEAVLQAVAESPELSDAVDLPIDGYESLAASQVVLRLGSLTPSELAAVAEYESSHRARRTILGKIHQLQAS
jgi:hypothetical protein